MEINCLENGYVMNVYFPVTSIPDRLGGKSTLFTSSIETVGSKAYLVDIMYPLLGTKFVLNEPEFVLAL